MAIWTVATHHGTCLAVDRRSGTLCHGTDIAGTDQVFACTSSGDDGFALLLSRSAMACPGGASIGRALSYRIAVRDGMPGFIVPATGLLLTAAPEGTVSADRHEQGGWEMFHLLPADDAAAGPGIAAPQDMRGGADFLVRYARSDGCDVAVLQALARLLDPSDARLVARRISGLALYADLCQVLRRHVSGGRRPFEWLTAERLTWGMAAHGWSIGAHTYGAPEVIDGQHGELRIGRYTSIAGQVQIVVANHATASLTSYPFAALADSWPGADPDVADHVGLGVVIGSDVWIGTGACILPGARIGDGAVIGARAVVAGNVPPYAVVVGNTARVVRKRFSDEQIDRLLALRWWCWPEHIVDRHLPLLLGENVDALLAVAGSPDATRRSG